METSPIYELLPAFNDRNHVIFMLLGLLSTIEDWTNLLEELAATPRPARDGFEAELQRLNAFGQDPELEWEDNPGRGFLYFVLGTLSFSRNFTHTLENARNSITPSVDENPENLSWGEPSELLR